MPSHLIKILLIVCSLTSQSHTGLHTSYALFICKVISTGSGIGRLIFSLDWSIVFGGVLIQPIQAGLCVNLSLDVHFSNGHFPILLFMYLAGEFISEILYATLSKNGRCRYVSRDFSNCTVFISSIIL